MLWCILRGHVRGVMLTMAIDMGDREIVAVRVCDRCGVLLWERRRTLEQIVGRDLIGSVDAGPTP